MKSHFPQPTTLLSAGLFWFLLFRAVSLGLLAAQCVAIQDTQRALTQLFEFVEGEPLLPPLEKRRGGLWARQGLFVQQGSLSRHGSSAVASSGREAGRGAS
jgi:hypothetical protein